jgi:hypothetical protein
MIGHLAAPDVSVGAGDLISVSGRLAFSKITASAVISVVEVES